MQEQHTKLDSPIDSMYLIHKALRTEAVRAERLADEVEIGGSLQSFKLTFNSWATALVFHAEQEDTHIISSLSNHEGPPHYNPLTSSSGDLKLAIAAQGEELHRELIIAVQDVLDVLDHEIGKTSVILRTKQHLYGEVVALRFAQEDCLETEEAIVLPLVRERMSERQQLEMVRCLLVDADAQDTRWMIDWVSKRLSTSEQELLADLENRMMEVSA
jgi:hypothetical protein